MNNIFEMIEFAQNRIAVELLMKDSKVDFYKSLNGTKVSSSIEDVCKLDSRVLATLLILCDNDDLDYNLVRIALNGARAFLGFCDDTDQAVGIFDYLEELLNMGAYETAIDVFSGDKKIRLREFFKESSLKIKAFEEYLTSCKIEPKKFVSFMRLYKLCPDQVFKSFSLMGAFKKAYSEMTSKHEDIQYYEDLFGIKVKSKEKNKYVNNQISNKWKVDDMLSIVREAFNYGNNLVNRDTSRRRMLMKKSKIYDELKDKLNEMSQCEGVIGIDSIIYKIPDKDIQLEVLKYIYNHNMELHRKVESEYQELSKCDISNYRLLFSNFGLNVHDEDLEEIMNNSLDDLEQILNLLKNMGLISFEHIIDILKVTSLDVISRLNDLWQASIISCELLKKNIVLFDGDSCEYSVLNKNISFLEEKGINPRIFVNSSALLFSNDLLYKNITILDKYLLLSSLNKATSFDFLISDSLDASIDTLIELGYEDYLIEDLDVLNYSNRFSRLRLLKELNIVVSSKDELISILSSDKFYVEDRDIDSYVYNSSLYNLPNLESRVNRDQECVDLEKFSISPRTYSFDGVLISKNRVLEGLKNIDSDCSGFNKTLYSILHGSVLSDSEVHTIKRCLKPDEYASDVVLVK